MPPLQLRTLTFPPIDPTACGTTVTLSCDTAFQLIDVDIVNTTDPAADNTYILTKDQDGAGPTFTQTLPIVGPVALGAPGTSNSFGVFVATGPAGFMFGTFVDPSCEVDSVSYAVNVEAPSTATCSIT